MLIEIKGTPSPTECGVQKVDQPDRFKARIAALWKKMQTEKEGVNALPKEDDWAAGWRQLQGQREVFDSWRAENRWRLSAVSLEEEWANLIAQLSGDLKNQSIASLANEMRALGKYRVTCLAFEVLMESDKRVKILDVWKILALDSELPKKEEVLATAVKVLRHLKGVENAFWAFLRAVFLNQPANAAALYKSPLFLEFMETPNVYKDVYASAQKSPDYLTLLKESLQKSPPTVRKERSDAVVAKLSGKGVVHEAVLSHALTEAGAINSSHLWLQILEKVLLKSSDPFKKKVWEHWLQSHSSLTDEKMSGKVWVQAMKLLPVAEVFSEALIKALSADIQIVVYREAVNLAKKSSDTLSSLMKIQEGFVDTVPPFEAILPLVNEGLKSAQAELAFRLVEPYVLDSQMPKWLQGRLSGDPLKKSVIPRACRLAEQLLNIAGALDEYAFAETCFKLKGEFLELAVRASFKALLKAAQEDLDKKVNLKNLERCFELMNTILLEATDKVFLNFLESAAEFQKEFNEKAQGRFVSFWEGVVSRCVKVQSKECGLPLASEFWKSIRSHAPERAEEFVKLIMTDALSYLMVSVPKDEGVWNTFLEKLITPFQEKVTYGPVVGGRMPQMRPIDIAVSMICSEAKKSKTHKCLLLTIACNLVKNQERFPGFLETSASPIVLEGCLSVVSEMNDPQVFDDLDSQPFLLAGRRVLELLVPNTYLKEEERERGIEEMIPFYSPDLFKLYLEMKKQPLSLQEFRARAHLIFSERRTDLPVQKVIWKFLIQVALEQRKDDEEWIEHLEELMEWIDEMLADGIVEDEESRSIPLDYVASVIEVCDFVAPRIYRTDIGGKKIAEALISAYMKIAVLNVNYRRGDGKRAMVMRLASLMRPYTCPYNKLNQLVELAKDMERREPYDEISIAKQGIVKITGCEAVGERTAAKRRGILDLFAYLLEDKLQTRFRSIVLAGDMIVSHRFEEFREKKYGLELLSLFCRLMRGLDFFAKVDVLMADVHHKVFFALMFWPNGGDAKDQIKWGEFSSWGEFLGTEDPECIRHAKGFLTEIIDHFFKTCGEEGVYLAQVKEEDVREQCLKDIKDFLRDCKAKNYFGAEEFAEYTLKYVALEQAIRPIV